jgi:hypothetical protein
MSGDTGLPVVQGHKTAPFYIGKQPQPAMTGFVSSATDFGTKTSLKEVLE